VFMPVRNGGYWSDQGYEWYGGPCASFRRSPATAETITADPR
jgi:DMSO/TMAO reductase YedYZ molybdopterin-dependent catalytic subunit